jgi:hypothetical protein
MQIQSKFILFWVLAGLIIVSFFGAIISSKATKPNKIWGAYLSDQSISSFESQAGKPMDIVAVFSGWGDSFPASDKSKTLLIFWEQTGITLDNIISGRSDSYIKQYADSIKSYSGPVMLAPLHEMNGNWNSWDGSVGNNTPQKVILAFQRIHDLFADVPNAEFVWAVNNESVPNTQANAIANYYPGDDYVNYVAVDGFNFGNPWQTYDQIFSSALSQLRAYKKPILITSMASAPGTNKAQWIINALDEIYEDNDVMGFVWFNENKEKNWLISSDPNSLQAFRDGIQKY